MTQILWDILTKEYLTVESMPFLQSSHISKVSCYCKRIQTIQGFIIVFTQFRISFQNMFPCHSIQMSLNRSTAYVPIATLFSRCITYYTIKISETCCCKFGISSRIPIRHQQKQPKCLVIIMHLSLHHIMHDDSIIGMSIWSDRVLFQSVLPKITLLSILPTNAIQMRNVTIHEKQEPIVLTCKRCQNVWEYHGNNPYVAKCSFCKTTVSVLKQKQNHKVPQPGQSTTTAQVAGLPNHPMKEQKGT